MSFPSELVSAASSSAITGADITIATTAAETASATLVFWKP